MGWRVRIGAVLAAMLVTGVGVAGSQEEFDEPPSPIEPSRGHDLHDYACDPTTGELVLLSHRWTNDTDAEMVVDPLVRFVQLPYLEAKPEEWVRTDLSHHYPTSLAPGESVTVGPIRLPGDLGWALEVGIEVRSDDADDPLLIGNIDPLYGPCPQYEPPPEVVPQEPASPIDLAPRFTG